MILSIAAIVISVVALGVNVRTLLFIRRSNRRVANMSAQSTLPNVPWRERS